MDRYGDIGLPVPTPEEGTAQGDPLLDTLLLFFEGVLTHDCKDVWNSVSGNIGNQAIVKRTFAHNPGAQAFREVTTPALYLWRGTYGSPIWKALGFRIRASELTLRWVPFMANSQERKRIWEPVCASFHAALDIAIERGRTPGWILSGDTDPMADTLGTFLYGRAKLWKLQLAEMSRQTMTINMEGAAANRVFEAVDFRLMVEELLVEDPAKYPEVAYAQTTLQSPAEPPTLPAPLTVGTGRFDFDPN
jgi:hypothetical protein